MERLLDHLRERMIRPLELLREFDKKNNGRITQAEFMSRLRVQDMCAHTHTESQTHRHRHSHTYTHTRTQTHTHTHTTRAHNVRDSVRET